MSTDLFVYANGDSFVEGCELGDFLLPDYPGISNYNCHDHSLDHPTRIWFTNLHTMGHPLWAERNRLMSDIKQQEQQRNFAYKLSQKLGAKYMNSGLGGSGNDRIARTTLRDLIELKKTEKNIVALIGITEILRMELPAMGKDDAWNIFHPGNPIENSVFSEITNYYYLHTKNYNRLINFYRHIILLNDFCKLNNIRLFFIAPFDPIEKVFIIEQEFAKEKDYLALKEYADYHESVNMNSIARDIDIGTKLPGYHFSELVHEHTANELLKLI
jgi:hypothetical protein